ncbi:unnamed protein product [Penicillium olsonii]|uniref:F-box domain-containing protein n=1 Tax=Penicillium olsonii TaxID=99116 RepID=A0A9W4IH29_PENOL|nr:unnamed protein product [Penicillium olsonii]CAG8277063.1 unnamed protein product [Penicillium olsonii]
MNSVFSSIVSGYRAKRLESPESPKLGSPDQNTLAGLPVEILLSITDLLLIDDWICISLCSRRLFAILAPRTKSFLPSGREKLPLLRRLERDQPELFICYASYILCRYDGSECFGPSSTEPACFTPYGTLLAQKDCPVLCVPNWGNDRNLVSRKKESIWSHVYYRILFQYLQHAVRLSQMDRPTQPDPYPSRYFQVRNHPSTPEITSLLSINALDHPEGVCLRMQQVNSVFRGEWELLFPRHDPDEQSHSSQPVFICPHISDFKQDILLDSIVDAWFHGEAVSASTFTCDICNTDAEIEIHRDGLSLALIVTTWINLDPGSTPGDPRQRVHCDSWCHRELSGENNPNEQTYSPRVFFEQASFWSLDDLRSCNLALLDKERYKKCLREVSPQDLSLIPEEKPLGGYWFYIYPEDFWSEALLLGIGSIA